METQKNNNNGRLRAFASSENIFVLGEILPVKVKSDMKGIINLSMFYSCQTFRRACYCQTGHNSEGGREKARERAKKEVRRTGRGGGREGSMYRRDDWKGKKVRGVEVEERKWREKRKDAFGKHEGKEGEEEGHK